MKQVVIWIALSLWSVMTVFAGETAYLFSYFINDSKDGLHLAYSCLLYTSDAADD